MSEAPADRSSEVTRRIVCDPEVLGGKPVVEGTRMSVEHLLGLIASGMTIDQIVASHPILTPSDVRGAVAYARSALRDDVVLEIPT